jgi:hypothetical protein
MVVTPADPGDGVKHNRAKDEQNQYAGDKTEQNISLNEEAKFLLRRNE